MDLWWVEPLSKSVLYVGIAVWCGYQLGKDAGVKKGASKTIDTLCDNGYLKFTKRGEEIEIHKLD